MRCVCVCVCVGVCVGVCVCQVAGDEGQPCGTPFAVQFNKVALELKNLMHPKKHFPHRRSLEAAVLRVRSEGDITRGQKYLRYHLFLIYFFKFVFFFFYFSSLNKCFTIAEAVCWLHRHAGLWSTDL